MEKQTFDRWDFSRLVNLDKMYLAIRSMLPAPGAQEEVFPSYHPKRIESKAMSRYRARRRKLNQISRSRAFNFRKAA